MHVFGHLSSIIYLLLLFILRILEFFVRLYREVLNVSQSSMIELIAMIQ